MKHANGSGNIRGPPPPEWIGQVSLEDTRRLALLPYGQPILVKSVHSDFGSEYARRGLRLSLSRDSLRRLAFEESSGGRLRIHRDTLALDQLDEVIAYVAGAAMSASDHTADHLSDYISVQLYKRD